MNSFDFSLYDYEDDNEPIKIAKPEKSPKTFDFSLYDEEEQEQKKSEEESSLSSLFRTGAQVPIGIAEATPPALIAGGLQFLGMGEVYDPEEIEHIRAISEREGIPFNEEEYLKSAENALQYFPTVSNVARIIEEQTGIPLEAKEWYQKALRLGSMGGKLQPGNTIQKGAAGVVSAGTSEVLKRLGVPEPFADLLGLSVGGGAGAATKGADVSLTKTKPSGLKERGFESLKNTREVTEGKFEKINTKLKEDFQKVTDEIVKGTPLAETIEELKNDPTYKQQSRELFREAENMALDLPGRHSTDKIKEALLKRAVETKGYGYKLGEYRQNYAKFLKDEVSNIRKGEFDAFDLVRQFRENNQDLGEYFKPGESKAFNRAKRDALLDHNRAIVDVMEELYPQTEFIKTFKEGNERWTKIMDAEAIGDFVEELFEGKVNYKKAHDFFDKEGLARPFKRALGEKGFKNFEQLMKDLTESETAYKMLKVAKSKGFNDLYQTGLGFILHPKLGIGKAGYELAKGTYKRMMNFMLDKPKISISLKNGIDNLKKGKFAEAEQAFKDVEAELYPVNEKPKAKAKLEREPEVLEAKVEPIKEERKPAEKVEENKLLEGKNTKPLKENVTEFTTEKGSTYKINEDQTTTRNKAYRKEHGAKEVGIQPVSEKTYYLDKESADKLSEFQAKGHDKKIIELPDGSLAIQYISGPHKGKIESRTIVKPSEKPAIGQIPLELWNKGEQAHFGNKIIKIIGNKKETISYPYREYTDELLNMSKNNFEKQKLRLKKEKKENSSQYQFVLEKQKQIEEEIERRKLENFEKRKEEAKNEYEKTGIITLTQQEKKSLLNNIKDVYKESKLRKVSKGVNFFGEEIMGYPYSPELFKISDLSGMPIRYYVELPDGRIAHPDEIIEAIKRKRINIQKKT